MGTDRSLREELQRLEKRREQLADRPETPRSTMGIIEYSLGSQRKAEVYVNRLLRYLLDPGEPHGVGSEFLQAFLEGVPETCEFEEDTYDLSDVRVSDQVQVFGDPGEESPESGGQIGLVDLVIEAPNEWFLVIELKFSAGENGLDDDGPSQTETYYRATRIDDRPTDEYESGQYYVYLHPQDEPGAREDGFANWTWTELAEDVLEPLLVDNAPRYPRRTVTQLRELVDDVQEITGMTDRQATDRAKVELYLEHYDAIADVTQTFEDRWETFTTEWGELLRERLEADGIDTGEWVFRDDQPDWAHLFKLGWWRTTDELEPVRERADDRNDVRISLVHRLEANRELAIGERTLVLTLRNCGSNDREFRDRFNRLFEERKDEIDRALPESAESTGQRRNLITASYDIRPEAHDDFFEAYVAALQRGFSDLLVENPELIRLVDDLYQEATEVYQ